MSKRGLTNNNTTPYTIEHTYTGGVASNTVGWEAKKSSRPAPFDTHTEAT